MPGDDNVEVGPDVDPEARADHASVFHDAAHVNASLVVEGNVGYSRIMR
jgi:hypothetical protein